MLSPTEKEYLENLNMAKGHLDEVRDFIEKAFEQANINAPDKMIRDNTYLAAYKKEVEQLYWALNDITNDYEERLFES